MAESKPRGARLPVLNADGRHRGREADPRQADCSELYAMRRVHQGVPDGAESDGKRNGNGVRQLRRVHLHLR